MVIKKEVKPKKVVHERSAAPVSHPKDMPAVPHRAPVKAVVAEPVVKQRYFEGIGRRKTATARTRVMKGSGKFLINNLTVDKYFQTPKLRQTAVEALKRLNMESALDISVKLEGGGINAQAEAVRHGITRALVLMKPEFKAQLSSLGFLTRDSRMVERKKYGLKKARRAPQWKKR
ncbi:MAG: 30S ribosomal protein S9 [Candidatus Liptonbacteria bacterium]|nr:30S ribosomal protein S9 [Candidatus Liptonbacteria bacterium]